MTNEEYQKISDNIKGKLSKEDFAKISDDLGNLRINNDTLEKSIINKEERYKKLEEYKNQLLEVNSNLQMQQPRGSEEDIIEKPKPKELPEEDTPKDVSIRSCFNKNGRFIM